MSVGKIRQLTHTAVPTTSIDALIDRRVTELLAEFSATYRAEVNRLREEVAATQTKRWPERMTPAILADYLGYRSSESLPDSWKALRHQDVVEGSYFYLKSEIDRELARRSKAA